MRAIITILDNTTETSMPFNEFVLYRAKHYENEKQILIICGPKGGLPKVQIPDSLTIVYAGKNLRKIRKTIKKVINGCQKERIPYVVHMHQVQSGFLAEMAMIGTRFRKNALFTVHSTFSGYKFHNKFLSFVNVLFAQRTTCVSETSYRDYPQIIKRIKRDRIKAIQNGVDTERIDAVIAGKGSSPHKTVKFIYVARLIPLKNHVFLLDVLEKCEPSIEFMFVGAEEADKKTRLDAERRNLSGRIIFTGLVPRNEVFQQLMDADYYISSSTLEGLPVSVLEAMYCGLPTILSDIPQHKEAAGNCKAVSVLPFEANKWSVEINRLADLKQEEREALSQIGKNYVLNNFSLKKMHAEYDALYSLLETAVEG